MDYGETEYTTSTAEYWSINRKKDKAIKKDYEDN